MKAKFASKLLLIIVCCRRKIYISSRFIHPPLETQRKATRFKSEKLSVNSSRFGPRQSPLARRPCGRGRALNKNLGGGHKLVLGNFSLPVAHSGPLSVRSPVKSISSLVFTRDETAGLWPFRQILPIKTSFYVRSANYAFYHINSNPHSTNQITGLKRKWENHKKLRPIWDTKSYIPAVTPSNVQPFPLTNSRKGVISKR